MMNHTNKKAKLRIVGSLQKFLKESAPNLMSVPFELHPSVKDLIEAQGIPHTEIFKVEINGKERAFDYNIQDKDSITVYPFEAVNADAFDPIFSRPSAFIVDAHLRKLAKILRLLGFDVRFEDNLEDKDIIQLSNDQHRIILTRDIKLLKNGNARYGYWVRSTDPDLQIKELFRRFSLAPNINPFSRCMKCNGELLRVDLKEVEDRVPPKVKEWHSDFFECTNCHQVYWQGSHYRKLQQKVKELIKLSRLILLPITGTSIFNVVF